ncbi:unnamed protein product [Prunus brigantina]
MCDDTKQYTYSSHTPALPTTRMGSVTHAGTANDMCETHNLMAFPPHRHCQRRSHQDKKKLHQPCPRTATPTLTLPTLASSQGQDHFLQLPRGPIRTGTGRNFKLKTGQKPRFSIRFPNSISIQT